MPADERVPFSDYVAARHVALLRTAFLLVGNRADAEDLLQTALARTFLRWDRIADLGAADGYVRRAMVNTRTSWWRLRRVDARPSEHIPEEATRDETARLDLHDALWRALAGLPRRQRAMVVLRYFEDMTEAEVARTLGVSVGTVKSTVSRALTRLRDDAQLRDDPRVSLPGEVGATS